MLDVRRRPVLAQGPYGPAHVPRVAPAPGGLVYASWWERLGAWLIDFALVLTAVFDGDGVGRRRDRRRRAPTARTSTTTRAAIATFVAFGATFIGMALYNAIGIGWRETTLGKQAVGLVVRAEDGSRAGYGRAFNRELLGRVLVEGLLSAFTLGLFWIASGLAAAADRKRQAWHDKMGQTIVVYGRGERRPKAEEAPLPDVVADAPRCGRGRPSRRGLRLGVPAGGIRLPARPDRGRAPVAPPRIVRGGGSDVAGGATEG